MQQSRIERTYRIAPQALFGACLTAMAYMRAQIKEQDAERGAIVAMVDGGPLAAATELSLQIMDDPEHARLVVVGRPPKHRGARRAVATLVQLVDQLLS